jgi:hypothetical protein
MKADSGSRSIAALLFFNISDRQRTVVNITPRPLYSRKRTPVSIEEKAGRFGEQKNIFSLPRFEPGPSNS